MRHPISLVVFLTGAAVLVVELLAIRVLSPYFGSTLYSVSSVITTILAALSLGYWIGGRLADSRPSLSLFYSLILAGGISVYFLKILSSLLLPAIGFQLSLQTGPLIASLIMFFLPAFLLGTLSPLAIKLEQMSHPGKGIGTISGSIFFWSTLGSIAGSLSTGFVLIPRFGLDLNLILVGSLLVIIGLAGLAFSGWRLHRLFLVFSVCFLAAAASATADPPLPPDAIFTAEGVYERITILERADASGQTARFLLQDRNLSAAAYLDSPDHVFPYTVYYNLYQLFHPDLRRALAIGGGGYTIPKSLLSQTQAIVDVAEIEPLLPDLARRYLLVPETERLRTHLVDGRRFLHDTPARYDLIYSDVYTSLLTIPPAFSTREFFQLARNRLTDQGIFVGNFIGSLNPAPDSLTLAQLRTFSSVFPNNLFFAVESPDSLALQNLTFVGFNTDRIPDPDHPVLTPYLDKRFTLDRFDLEDYPLLTDNYAPTEYLTSVLVAREY